MPPCADESAASSVLVNLQTLALTLNVSRQTLSLWIRKWPEFPVEQAGTNGLAYKFNVAKVISFLRAKKAAEASDRSARDEALAQLVLPFAAELEAPASPTVLSIKDQLDAVRLSKLHREEAERLGQLVPAAGIRQGLTTALAAWQRNMHAALRRGADECNLPDAVVRTLDARLADAQRTFVRDLRTHLGAIDAV